MLEFALSDVKESWIAKGFGVELGAHEKERLTNLRLADDILLVAESRAAMREMVSDLKRAAHSVGLELHMGKTKVMTNEFARPEGIKDTLLVDETKIDILSSYDSTMYLGRSLNLVTPQDAEIDFRMSFA